MPGFLQRQRWRFSGRYRRLTWTWVALCVAVVITGNYLAASHGLARVAVDFCAVAIYLAGSAYLRRRFGGSSKP
jgi:hypothetical protein